MQKLPKDPKDMYVLVEGLHGDHYMPIEQFNPEGYVAMLRAYEHPIELNDEYAEFQPLRSGVRVVLYDQDTGATYDDAETVRAALQAVGKWMDKLPLSVVPRREEESLLAES